MSMMDVRVQVTEGTPYMILTGSFDFTARRQFRHAYQQALNVVEANVIKVDLGGIQNLDSSALGMLLLFQERAASKNMTICLINCSSTILHILEVGGFQNIFTIE